MENNERVLGYSKARELTHEDLSEISGGRGQMCSRPSMHITGYTGAMDGSVDWTLDW